MMSILLFRPKVELFPIDPAGFNKLLNSALDGREARTVRFEFAEDDAVLLELDAVYGTSDEPKPL
jgi:hypothetical protein